MANIRTASGVFALFLAGFMLFGCGTKETEKPNVILISIDTLRADHLGCYGYDRDTSPNIDAFAKDAVLFENAFSTACWTAPSHMSMFTGLYPSVHKVNTHPIPAKLNDDIKTLTQYLKADGYSTHGLYYGHYLAPELGFDRGFDSYVQKDFIKRALPEALALFDDMKDGKEPFFLFLHVGDVHAPYMDMTQKDPEYKDLYDPDYEGPIITGSEEEALAVALRLWKKEDVGRDIRHLVALYDGAIKHTDNYLGRLFNGLKENGLYDNTLIVFMSDHGEEFGEHNNFGHQQLYRELIHVPLLIKFPVTASEKLGIRPGLEAKPRVMLLDILPTVLELLGMQTTAYQQGSSLLGLFNGSYKEPIVFGESEMKSTGYQSHRSVLIGEQHYLKNEVPVKPDRPEVERKLYLVGKDPEEKSDVAKDNPAKLAEFDETLNVWQKKMTEDRAKVTKEVGEAAPAKMSKEQIDWLKSLGYIQ